MIPTFVMPPVLQTLAQISPMAWSLNGFLDALVRGANVGDLAGSCALLVGSAAILWLASAGILKRGTDDDCSGAGCIIACTETDDFRGIRQVFIVRCSTISFIPLFCRS